jgi:hypothetical protein
MVHRAIGMLHVRNCLSAEQGALPAQTSCYPQSPSRHSLGLAPTLTPPDFTATIVLNHLVAFSSRVPKPRHPLPPPSSSSSSNRINCTCLYCMISRDQCTSRMFSFSGLSRHQHVQSMGIEQICVVAFGACLMFFPLSSV